MSDGSRSFEPLPRSNGFRQALAAWCVFAGQLACEAGREVDLGALARGGSGGASAGAAGVCDGCADYRGARSFTVGGAPANSADLFDVANEAAPDSASLAMPHWIYPSAETALPPNLA